MDVLEITDAGADDGVDQPELSVRMTELEGAQIPAESATPAEVEPRRFGQRMTDQPPMHQVAGVMQSDAGKPLEGAGGEIVVFADTHKRRVRVAAAEYGIVD